MSAGTSSALMRIGAMKDVSLHVRSNVFETSGKHLPAFVPGSAQRQVRLCAACDAYAKLITVDQVDNCTTATACSNIAAAGQHCVVSAISFYW
jgi:hypothetical protein